MHTHTDVSRLKHMTTAGAALECIELPLRGISSVTHAVGSSTDHVLDECSDSELLNILQTARSSISSAC